MKFMNCLQLCVLLVAMPILPVTASAAGLPDVLFSTVEGKYVEVQKSNGETVLGTLQAFDASSAVVVLDDGSVLAMPRSEIVAIKIVTQGANPPGAGTSAPPPTQPETEVEPQASSSSNGAVAEEAPKVMPETVQHEIRSLTAAKNRLMRANNGFSWGGTFLFAGGLITTIIVGVQYDSALTEVEEGDADADELLMVAEGPGHIGGGIALMAWGGACWGISAALNAAAGRKALRIRELNRRYSRLQPQDLRLYAFAIPGQAAAGLSLRF